MTAGTWACRLSCYGTQSLESHMWPWRLPNAPCTSAVRRTQTTLRTWRRQTRTRRRRSRHRCSVRRSRPWWMRPAQEKTPPPPAVRAAPASGCGTRGGTQTVRQSSPTATRTAATARTAGTAVAILAMGHRTGKGTVTAASPRKIPQAVVPVQTIPNRTPTAALTPVGSAAVGLLAAEGVAEPAGGGKAAARGSLADQSAAASPKKHRGHRRARRSFLRRTASRCL
mmetsp:Transcript_15176/g.45759  ORF Transcript_15176/g.45759 Transcript_15176/m.45759 type:complete len:226 (-) Transcript_15176:883-1560(-)